MGYRAEKQTIHEINGAWPYVFTTLFPHHFICNPYLGYSIPFGNWRLILTALVQEAKTMVGTFRAVATCAAMRRPKLLMCISSFNEVDAKTRYGCLYAHSIDYPIQLDGDISDWEWISKAFS